MKLLLTSSGMGVKNEILKFLPKPYDKIKMAYITTGSKVESDSSYSDKEKELLEKEIGCSIQEMSFEGKIQEEVYDLLSDKDVIYVQGGNTFYLLKVLKESGADKVIIDLVKKGMLYIGVSAGSYIACPTIEMAKWKHQDKNTCGLKNLTALGFIPFLITAHYENKNKDIVKQEIKKTTYPVRVLTDEQALLVIDDSVELVGKGQKIK